MHSKGFYAFIGTASLVFVTASLLTRRARNRARKLAFRAERMVAEGPLVSHNELNFEVWISLQSANWEGLGLTVLCCSDKKQRLTLFAYLAFALFCFWMY